MKFLEVFNEIEKGNYALTDEAMYASIKNSDKMIPLYGGNQSHKYTDRKVSITAKTKKGESIRVFQREGIIISLDGSAGSMTYKNREIFALNHHAGFITLKQGVEKKVLLEYFALFFQNFYRSLSISDGSKTLSLEQIYSEEIELPPYDVQVRIMNKLAPIIKKMNVISKLKEKYHNLMQKSILFENEEKNNSVPLNTMLKYCSRNDALSEEGIYNRKQVKEYIDVLSGSSNNINYGRIDKSSEGIHFIENKQCIHLISRGNAGKLKYIDIGTYATNTNAFLLYMKDEYKQEKKVDTYEKERIILKFLIIYLQPIFFELASNSDLGVFPLTEVIANLKVPDIEYSDRLKKIVNSFEVLEKRVEEIELIEKHYQELINKQISVMK